MHFLVKALVQNAVAVLPRRLGQPLYYALQRRLGALRRVDYGKHLRRAAEIAEVLRQQGLPLHGDFLEVGTGWLLGTPLGLWLAGARHVTTVDLHRHVRPELVLELLAYVAAHETELPALFPWVPAAELQAKCRQLAGCRTLAEVSALTSVRYLAPADATRLPLPVAGFDCHYSTNVLEHVPPAVLTGLLAEARRVLRPGGHLVHFVDLSDHFAHDDPRLSATHFLRYGPRTWAALAGNRFMYQNRLRQPQYAAQFAAAGLRICWERLTVNPASLARLQAGQEPLHADFQKFSPEALAATFWVVLAQAE